MSRVVGRVAGRLPGLLPKDRGPGTTPNGCFGSDRTTGWAPLTVGRMLDTPELTELVGDLAALRHSPRGRPGYTTRSLLGACLVKSLYRLPTWAQVARLIGEDSGLQGERVDRT